MLLISLSNYLDGGYSSQSNCIVSLTIVNIFSITPNILRQCHLIFGHIQQRCHSGNLEVLLSYFGYSCWGSSGQVALKARHKINSENRHQYDTEDSVSFLHRRLCSSVMSWVYSFGLQGALKEFDQSAPIATMTLQADDEIWLVWHMSFIKKTCVPGQTSISTIHSHMLDVLSHHGNDITINQTEVQHNLL